MAIKTGTSGNDTIFGTDDDDDLFGGIGQDYLIGGNGNDRLYGGSEVDRLEGGAGNDFLFGGSGNDVMIGGAGDDTYFVDDRFDTVVEQSGQGTDTVFSSITFAAPGPVENVTLTGSANINATGNGLKNTLIGNAGNNVLDGGAYDDVLNGGAGADTLIGGAGFDTFIFTKGETAGDFLADFRGFGAAFGDRIIFQGYGENATAFAMATGDPNLGFVLMVRDDDGEEFIDIPDEFPPFHPSDFLFV